MPLVWAHAEYIKLARSCALGRPCDRPEDVWQRYRGRRPASTHAIWAPRFPLATLGAGQALTICLPAPAQVHFGVDGWQRAADVATADSGLGVHLAQLPSAALAAGQRIEFTFHWSGNSSWEGRDYEVQMVAPQAR